MPQTIRVLVVGMGNMGVSHAKAYHGLEGFEIIGLCGRHLSVNTELPESLASYPRFDDYSQALDVLQPDAVSINTWPDSHADYACQAFAAGAHVFLEKPLAETVAAAKQVLAMARRTQRKLVIGYILRHHPSWLKLVDLAHTLGKPLVMRMNLNQQSSGQAWQVHKQLMQSLSPIVDCGVHYVDMMCLMTRAAPIKVHAIGASLSDETSQYNYGHLQVQFDDGSVGWYEAGWGPMMSETAFFVKDVIGPKGSASIVMKEGAGSSDIDTHTKTNRILLHSADLDTQGQFSQADTVLDMRDEPDHDELCVREQRYFLRAIHEDLDLNQHMDDALNSLRIVLAADQSVRSGLVVDL